MREESAVHLLDKVFGAGEKLQEKGFLDWAGLDYSNRTVFDNALPVPTYGDEGNGISSYEVSCHAYFFSGLFYPRAGSTDVKYRYDASVAGFVRSGKGPFLTAVPFTVSDLGNPSKNLQVSSRNLSELAVDLTTHALEVYIEEQEPERVAGHTQVSHLADEALVGNAELWRVPDSASLYTLLRRNTHTSLVFTRQETDGRVRHVIKTHSVTMRSSGASDAFDTWIVDVHMGTFDVLVNERILPSKSRFISDVMGIIFFALGLSVYSVIVGPTNVIFFGLTLQKWRRPSISSDTDTTRVRMSDAHGGESDADPSATGRRGD